MRRRSPALLAVTLGAIVSGLIGYAAEQTPAKAPAASTAQPKAAASKAVKGAEAQAVAIAWFGNAIQATASLKLLRASSRPTELQRIAAILEKTRASLNPFTRISCRWACPPGECSPDCLPRLPIDPNQRLVDPALLEQPDNGPIILNLYVATIEGLALEAPSAHYGEVVAQLRGTLDEIAK